MRGTGGIASLELRHMIQKRNPCMFLARLEKNCTKKASKKLNFQAVIKSAASAASPTAWELHGSAPAGCHPLAEPSSWRSHATSRPSGGLR